MSAGAGASEAGGPEDLSNRLREAARERGLELVAGFPDSDVGEDDDEELNQWDDETDVSGFVHAAATLGDGRMFVDETRDESGRLTQLFATYVGETGDVALIWLLDDSPLEEPPPKPSSAHAGPSSFRDDLRAVVDRLVSDPSYDVFHEQDSRLVARATAGMSEADRAEVTREASQRFGADVDRHLNTEAEVLARQVAAQPDYSPLSSIREKRELVTALAAALDPRLVPRAVARLASFDHEGGARDAAREKLRDDAELLLAELPLAVRDRFGFAYRMADEDAILAPYLEHLSVHERRRLVVSASAVETELYSEGRERRYATAVRTLLAQDMQLPEVSELLGISTGRLRRIRADHPDDVVLAPDDPLQDVMSG